MERKQRRSRSSNVKVTSEPGTSNERCAYEQPPGTSDSKVKPGSGKKKNTVACGNVSKPCTRKKKTRDTCGYYTSADLGPSKKSKESRLSKISKKGAKGMNGVSKRKMQVLSKRSSAINQNLQGSSPHACISKPSQGNKQKAGASTCNSAYQTLKPGSRNNKKTVGGSVGIKTITQIQKKTGTKRLRNSVRNDSDNKDVDDDNCEQPHKRSKTQYPATVTTRSMRAKKDGVTRFIFDKVCNCSESVYYTIFTDHGVVKGCPCGKRYKQFMKLTGGLDSALNQDDQSKRQRSAVTEDYFHKLSIEIVCYIFQYLTLKEMLRFESMSKQLQKAVHASLRLRENIDFNEDVKDKKLFENNLTNLTNHMFSRLLAKLPKLRYIYNFHPAHISQQLAISPDVLTVPIVCDTICSCKSLEGIEISNMELLEDIVMRTVHPKIIGKFQNRNRQFPVFPGITVVLKDDSKITNLHLVGCSVYYLPQMDGHLEHLYLRLVKFQHHHPFKDFSACKLKSFVMSHCVGPSSALKYIPLLTALADARGLKRLELQRVPFLGGVIQHICEDNWQDGGFRRLESVTMGECKSALDADLGYLIIAAAVHIESLRMQPSLTKDAVFAALAISDVTINPGFEELCIGWKDTVTFYEAWTDAELVTEGLADLPESQSRITDSGMRLLGQCFPPLKKLEVHTCPHLMNPILWFTPDQQYLRRIQELTLDNCHSLRLDKFCAFLTFLPDLRYLTLREIFKERPLGCSRVGLSAGTGLGISSALINPQPLVNNPGVLNNNGGNVADNAAANGGNNDNDGALDNIGNQNHQDHGNLGNIADGNENEGANQEGENLANQNEGAEFENQNGHYNLRHSSRRRSSGNLLGQGSSGLSSVQNTSGYSSKKSHRFVNKSKHSYGRTSQNDNNPTNHGNGKTTEHSPGVSGSNTERSTCKQGVVSRKGKALVTKKGLVSKVKSSKGKENEMECNAEEDSDEDIQEVKPKCTCVKETAEVGCQASNDDIKKSNNQKHVKKRGSGRKSRDQDKIIIAGQYRPSYACTTAELASVCELHQRKKRYKPVTADRCDSTYDPVWEDDHRMVLTIVHRRLEYLKLDAIGITELNIVCYNLHTLSITRCRVLKNIKIKEAPFLEKVHVSQCRKVNEDFLLDEIYRLPPNRSKFVSLRPLHYVDESLYHDLMLFGDFQHYNFGTVMMFDYSDKPSETNYNKLRMKSWTSVLERLTTMTMMDHGWQKFHEMEHPNKGLMTEEGESSDGSRWKLFADIPWISVLSQCPDMEEKNIKNPEWRKAGVYSMELKGHFSFWDAYTDVQDYIYYLGPDQCGLYECNVLTYVNMCDINGTPSTDALCIV